MSSSKTQAVPRLWRRHGQRTGPPRLALHLFAFSLGPTVFSESVPVSPSVGPVLLCMRRKGAAVRFAFSRKAGNLVVETRADRVPVPRPGCWGHAISRRHSGTLSLSWRRPAPQARAHPRALQVTSLGSTLWAASGTRGPPPATSPQWPSCQCRRTCPSPPSPWSSSMPSALSVSPAQGHLRSPGPLPLSPSRFS